LHGVDPAGDAAGTWQGNGPRAAVAEGAEKILRCLAREQRGVTADLSRGQMCVATPQNGEPVLAGCTFNRRGTFAAEGKARLDRIWQKTRLCHASQLASP